MGKRILVIDDDILVLKSVSALLRRQGYVVEEVQSGMEALEKIETNIFDLIVCDMRMPCMDGIQTVTEIRNRIKEKKCPAIPEIILTGYAEESLKKKASLMKVACYLYKPFDISEFIAAVQKTAGSPK